ncbi:MAG: aromatic-ring-hydroxylating dioxygenase subunit beta [Pseudomonadota bacterium]
MTAKTEEQLERECAKFYYREAELLDNGHFGDWLELVLSEIDYRVPVRTTRDNRDGDGFSTRAYFMQEDFGSLKMRVRRIASPYAWAENPRTRTRRMVGNIRVGALTGSDLQVTTNLAVFCHRSDASTPLILTCERKDVLRQQDGEWKLASRVALLDATVLGLESLSIFL